MHKILFSVYPLICIHFDKDSFIDLTIKLSLNRLLFRLGKLLEDRRVLSFNHRGVKAPTGIILMNTSRCQGFPSIIRGYRSFDPTPSMGVTSFRPVILFLFVVGILVDRNRDPGRVPGSPWNLSIRPTRSPPPPPRLPTYSFFASLHLPAVSRVPLSLGLTHLLPRVSSFFVFPQLASLLFTSLYMLSPSWAFQFHCLL